MGEVSTKIQCWPEGLLYCNCGNVQDFRKNRIARRRNTLTLCQFLGTLRRTKCVCFLGPQYHDLVSSTSCCLAITFLPNVFSQVSPSSCPVSQSIRVVVLINGSTPPSRTEHRHRVRHQFDIKGMELFSRRRRRHWSRCLVVRRARTQKWIHQRIQAETDFDTIDHAEPLAEVHKMGHT